MWVHVCMCVCVSVRACKEVARIWLNQSWHTYGEINAAHIRMSARFDESLHTYGGISHGTHMVEWVFWNFVGGQTYERGGMHRAEWVMAHIRLDKSWRKYEWMRVIWYICKISGRWWRWRTYGCIWHGTHMHNRVMCRTNTHTNTCVYASVLMIYLYKKKGAGRAHDAARRQEQRKYRTLRPQGAHTCYVLWWQHMSI